MTTKGFYTFVLYKNGDVWCYGHNSNFELGLGHSTAQSSPIKHEFLSSLHVKDIFGWCYGGYAITSKDEIYVWGLDAYMEGVDGSTSTPVPCKVLSNKQITHVFAYCQNLFYSSRTNTSYSFSFDTSSRPDTKPYPLHTLLGLHNIIQGDIGDDMACFVIGPFSRLSLFTSCNNSKLLQLADIVITSK